MAARIENVSPARDGNNVRIAEKIRAYHAAVSGDEHHRYRSWEHCYRYFRARSARQLVAARDGAALQLGFYLASWGMYRGSSFLLQHAYTVHLRVIEAICAPQFRSLWGTEFGSRLDDVNQVQLVLDAVEAVRGAYVPFGQPTDTLVTKVLLGTMGCLPACDRYFLYGFKSEGFSYSYLNRPFVQRVLQFCRSNVDELRKEQTRIASNGGPCYSMMKLVDMYFWQIGSEAGVTDPSADEAS